jgi:hypothetical protein
VPATRRARAAGGAGRLDGRCTGGTGGRRRRAGRARARGSGGAAGRRSGAGRGGAGRGAELGVDRRGRHLHAVAGRDGRGLVRDRRDRALGLGGLAVGLGRAGRIGVHARDAHVVGIADLEVALLEATADGVLGRAVIAEADAVKGVLAVAGLLGAARVADLEAEHVVADEPEIRKRLRSRAYQLRRRESTYSVHQFTW